MRTAVWLAIGGLMCGCSTLKEDANTTNKGPLKIQWLARSELHCNTQPKSLQSQTTQDSYCVEMDNNSTPPTCTITTLNFTNHRTLGLAAQNCLSSLPSSKR